MVRWRQFVLKRAEFIFKTLRLTSVYIVYDVTSQFSESADFGLITVVMIDSSIQASHCGAFIECVITQQLLREQFRRCWRGGWRWLMSWGTGHRSWAQRELSRRYCNLFLFLYFFEERRSQPEAQQSKYCCLHSTVVEQLVCGRVS